MAYSEVQRILRAQPRPDSRLSKIRSYLDKEGGFHQSVKNSLKGRHGGLVGVIDTIAEGIKKEAVERYVTAVFLDCVDPLDYDQRVRFMKEYLKRYGSVLLPGEEKLSPYELAVQLESVVEAHVALVNRVREKLQ